MDFGHHDPLRDGETPLFCLTAVCVSEDSWYQLDRDYLSLKLRFFSKEIGTGRPEQWEIKGSELTQPHSTKSRRKQEFLRQVLLLCNQYQTSFFSVVIIKNPGRPISRASMYGMALQYLAERFQSHLEELQVPDTGIMIADSRLRNLDIEVALSHLSFRFGNPQGRLLDKIIEAPLFTHSQLTVGLQLVDIVGSCIYAYHYQKNCSMVGNAVNYSHIAQFWPYVNSRQFKSERLYDGYTRNGFRILDYQV